MILLKTNSIYYNDVNLIARTSVVNSRSEVPKELDRIMVSPMAAVVGKDFAVEAANLGLSVCLHRFCKPKEQGDIYSSISDNTNVHCSIGLDDWDRVKHLNTLGVKKWVIDCANGYIPRVKEVAETLLSMFACRTITIGNIMTGQGIINYRDLIEKYNKVKFQFRIGIAGGKACSTSDATGYNRGQITEIDECFSVADELGCYVIADGGVKNGNYACKAFGAGADYVMMGSYFAKAREAHTWQVGDGTYWGGASTKQQELFGGVRRHSEGKVIELDADTTKPLSELTDELWGGIASGVSYSCYPSLTQFIGNGLFEIKQNSLPPGR